MDEEEFRQFLENRKFPAELIARLNAYIQQVAHSVLDKHRGPYISAEKSEQLAAVIRKAIVGKIALHETGVISFEEATSHLFDPDNPPDELKRLFQD